MSILSETTIGNNKTQLFSLFYWFLVYFQINNYFSSRRNYVIVLPYNNFINRKSLDYEAIELLMHF
jgi:hypothetical protein